MDGMDMLQGIRDAEGQIPGGPPPLGDDFVMPSIEQMLEALEKMDMSDEDKANLRETLTERSKFGEDMMADFFKPAFEILPTGNPLMTYVLIFAALVVLTLFAKMYQQHHPYEPEEIDPNMDPEEFRKKYEEVTKRIEDMAEKLRDLPKEEQEKFFAKMGMSMGGGGEHAADFVDVTALDYLPFFICFMIMLCVFVFFGYKLYRSLTEKQRKRDEKRKQKQLKKKK